MAPNVVASRPAEFQPTGTLTARANIPGILISGGFGTGTSVEVYSLNNQCVLPSLPLEMYAHTSDEGTLCGGDFSNNSTCITFSSGKWVTSHALAEERIKHTSWYNKEEGKIILMGGLRYRGKTTEIITEGENKGVPGFKLKYDTK